MPRSVQQSVTFLSFIRLETNIGKFVLNISALSESESTSGFLSLLSSLLPRVFHLPLSIEFLNAAALGPLKDYEVQGSTRLTKRVCLYSVNCGRV
jgi:hypothetical protein